VTDRYAVYKSFKTHQYCLAHLIREFKAYGEREGPDKAIGLARISHRAEEVRQ
jgi:Transposase IS66 family